MQNNFKDNKSIETKRYTGQVYSAFRNGEVETKHYNVRILKFQPTKVMINGRIKDRTALTAEERAAVKTKEDIDKARAILRQQYDINKKASE